MGCGASFGASYCVIASALPATNPPPPLRPPRAPTFNRLQRRHQPRPGESHLYDLTFNLTNPARFIRSETYLQGAGAEETKLTLVRVEPAS